MLRNLIRNIILSELKIEKTEQQLADIELKRDFIKKADQNSLQNLRYIHWGKPKEISNVIRSNGRSEISTAIHPKTGKIIPWSLDENSWDYAHASSFGIELKGFVTWASNVDVDSGRHGTIHGRKDLPSPFDFQMKTSGIPKRPNIGSVNYRIEASKILEKIKAGLGITPKEERFLEEYGDWDALFQRDGKTYRSAEDIMILKEKDLVPTPSDYYFGDDLIGLWPEAILDNWKPIKLHVSKDVYMGDPLDLPDDILDLLDHAGEKNIPIVSF